MTDDYPFRHSVPITNSSHKLVMTKNAIGPVSLVDSEFGACLYDRAYITREWNVNLGTNALISCRFAFSASFGPLLRMGTLF
jgi:hypothetical protein